MKSYMLLAMLMLTAFRAAPDAIVIDGIPYDNVYIRETENVYYVSIPDQGKNISARKVNVNPQDVVFGEDETARKQLLAVYKRNAAKLRNATGAQDEASAVAPKAGPSTWVAELERDGMLHASVTFARGSGPVSISATGTAKPNVALWAAQVQWNIAQQEADRRIVEQWERAKAEALWREAAAQYQALLFERARRDALAREYRYAVGRVGISLYAPYAYGVTTIYSPFGIQTTHVVWPRYGVFHPIGRRPAPRHHRGRGTRGEKAPDKRPTDSTGDDA